MKASQFATLIALALFTANTASADPATSTTDDAEKPKTDATTEEPATKEEAATEEESTEEKDTEETKKVRTRAISIDEEGVEDEK